ncbi:hypothetical protein ACHAXT_009487 [Thalassiosira profunda]
MTVPSINPAHIPPGMTAVHVGVPFLPAALAECAALGSKKAFVLANNSSRKHIEGDDAKLIEVLRSKGLLAAPLCTSVGMGGGEDGLLSAADAAYEAEADVVVTVGGGAAQDAGKLIRLWLSTRGEGGEDGGKKKCTVAGIKAAAARNPMPSLPPQICIPNSFAMAEATHVAGITTNAKVKAGTKHPNMMPTVIIYDPTLSEGLPDWVRFGTALRGVEHAVGAVTHPKATEEVRSRALAGLKIIKENLPKMVANPESPEIQSALYVGGFTAVRALNMGCYPTIGHLIQNQYSARFNVHQGSCSGILCARIMDYHCPQSKELQRDIAEVLGDADAPAPRLVRDLVATLPGVNCEHSQVGVLDELLRQFTDWMFKNHLERYNELSPREFTCVEDIYGMMTKPLAEL